MHKGEVPAHLCIAKTRGKGYWGSPWGDGWVPVKSCPSSSPYDFSKTIVENVKENGEKTQGTGENPFWGLPYTCDGVLPSQSIPTANPFWEQHPWLDQVASLANSGAWGVAIMGKFIFSPSRGTLALINQVFKIRWRWSERKKDGGDDSRSDNNLIGSQQFQLPEQTWGA